MDAELIERLRDASALPTGLYAEAVTQGAADNARIAELEAKLATAERDALERAAVIAEEAARDCPTGTIEHSTAWDIVHQIRAAKEQDNG